MQTISIDLDDEALGILKTYAASRNLPEEGCMIMALVAAANEKTDDPIPLAPANERLAMLADLFESTPPSTPDEVAEFAEELRYMAQFVTTVEIPRLDARIKA